MDKYIKVKTFEDFYKNQKKLIDILNHNMTKMEVNMSTIKNDVCWMKKILWAIFGIVVVSFVSIIIKAGLGV
jgi:hypothetical protein